MLAAALRILRRQFMTFTAEYVQRVGPGRAHILLKRNHSLRVHALARHIVMAEGLSRPAVYVAAALLHDIGRFPQFACYGTYRDDRSVDHGEEGVRVLADSTFLDAFNSQDRMAITEAVRMHNKRELPVDFCPYARSLCEVVRDADKLDIIPVVLRSMQPQGPRDSIVTLDLEDDPNVWSSAVLDVALAGDSPAYTQLRYLNDFKILLATWGAGLTFAASRDVFVRRKYLDRLYALLPAADPLTCLKDELTRRLVR